MRVLLRRAAVVAGALVELLGPAAGAASASAAPAPTRSRGERRSPPTASGMPAAATPPRRGSPVPQAPGPGLGAAAGGVPRRHPRGQGGVIPGLRPAAGAGTAGLRAGG